MENSARAPRVKTSDCVNAGFGDVFAAFSSREWDIVDNKENRLVFANPERPYDQYIIEAGQNTVHVVVPMPSTSVSFRTEFPNYFDASEYILKRFEEYQASMEVQRAAMPSTREYEDD